MCLGPGGPTNVRNQNSDVTNLASKLGNDGYPKMGDRPPEESILLMIFGPSLSQKALGTKYSSGFACAWDRFPCDGSSISQDVACAWDKGSPQTIEIMKIGVSQI